MRRPESEKGMTGSERTHDLYRSERQNSATGNDFHPQKTHRYFAKQTSRKKPPQYIPAGKGRTSGRGPSVRAALISLRHFPYEQTSRKGRHGFPRSDGRIGRQNARFLPYGISEDALSPIFPDTERRLSPKPTDEKTAPYTTFSPNGCVTFPSDEKTGERDTHEKGNGRFRTSATISPSIRKTVPTSPGGLSSGFRKRRSYLSKDTAFERKSDRNILFIFFFASLSDLLRIRYGSNILRPPSGHATMHRTDRLSPPAHFSERSRMEVFRTSDTSHYFDEG